jgi:RNA polymerase sigma-70 factor (ECF subfamily)
MEARQLIGGSDRDLAGAVLHRGDERAFRELYRRHTPRLLGFVSRLLGGTGTEAEDVVQEAWIRACGSLEHFRWESAFSTWLLGIGLNVVRQHMRRNARPGLMQMENSPDPPAPAATHEDRMDLERCIQSLPDGYRMVLVLHDVEEMKHREIAERLGISVGTSKSQLSSGRKLLRAMLSRSMEIGHE